VKLWYLLLLAAMPMQAAIGCPIKSNVHPFPASGPWIDTTELPAPVVEKVSVTRGLDGAGSCDRLGLLSIQLRWPRAKGVDVENVGFEYRVLRGRAPEGMLPDAAVAAPPVSGRRTEHLLTWDDGPQVRGQPLDLLVEVRAITRDYRRGPPAVFVIDEVRSR